MPIVTAISIEGLIILGTWPIPFLLGGVIGWVLRGCLRHKDSEPDSTATTLSRSVRERVPETEDSEPESTATTMSPTTWWMTSETRGRCLHMRPDCSTLSNSKTLIKLEFEGAKPTAILKNGKELSRCTVCEERPRRKCL